MRSAPARIVFGILSVGLLPLMASPDLQGQSLEGIAREISGRRLRVSSGLFDPESNLDALPIPAGETLTIAEIDGPGEIRHLWLTIGALDRRFTRSLVFRAYWDGSDVAAIESPIGDFFAAGNGMRANVSSLPIEVTSYGRAFNSYWPMPFRTRARLTLTNESDKPVEECYFYVDWLRFETLPRDALYFHARYRQEFPVAPFSPYTLAEIRGRGHYVGTVLSIHSSMAHWLGESDDRFYVDGEETPSLVGTGMEDYFTDAWNLRLFTNLRAGVSIYEPRGPDQRATMYRWHIADPITFTTSLRVEIERRSYAALVNPATGTEVTWDFKYRPDFFSSVAFWYAAEPAPRFWPFPSVRERLLPEIFVETTPLADQLRRSPGLAVMQKPTRVGNAPGGPLRRLMTYVQNDRVGAWLEVPVHIEEAGDYAISVYQVLYHDYGIWKVTMAGDSFERLLDPAMDFYDDYAEHTFNMPDNFLYGTWHENKVGIHSLEPGVYTIRFECVGSNAMARTRGASYTFVGHRVVDADPGQPGYNMGLDGITLRKLPWERMWTWMQEYLQREEQVFAERAATARMMVQKLVTAIERFKSDLGEYPRALDDLLRRPARLQTKVGQWPYVSGDRIPLDPWGQPFQFVRPGVRNPQSFDLWSFHGNSRAPAAWIGNWEHR